MRLFALVIAQRRLSVRLRGSIVMASNLLIGMEILESRSADTL